MNRIARWRPSPAMAVALLALFVSLGGVSYGVATGSIGTREIRNNSVSTRDIRNDTIRGTDIRRGSVTGSDIDEQSLSKVPRAGRADTATSAGSAASAASAGNAGTLDGVDSGGFLRVNPNRVRAAADLGFADNYAGGSSLLDVSNLAGGEYVVWAKLNVDSDSNAVTNPNCDLVAGGTVLDQAQNQLGPDAGPAAFLEFTMIGTLTASAAGTDDVFIRCEQAAGNTNDAYNRQIVAVRVD